MKMSSRSNYRVKVDLTKYHQDARRFSWIYVDCTNIWFISHVKKHIADIFGTEEPFHLLLNGKEYLPPSEDARVLKENELIAVVPGTGISNVRHNCIINHSIDTNNTDDGAKKSQQMPIDLEQKCDKLVVDDSIADICNIADATIYHSIWEGTEVEDNSNTKTTDENSTYHGTSDLDGAPFHKRKRIRRKRSKHVTVEGIKDNKDRTVKTLHLPTPVFPSGKHIHFDNSADERVSGAPRENGSNEAAVDENEMRKESSSSSPMVISKTRVANLSTLLSLRQTSTPLMFVNKKAKHTSENNKLVDAKLEISKDVECNGKKCVNEIPPPSDYSNLDPEKYPSLENVTELNDIIAFKILKIGTEYTPEVSDYIVGKTISWCPKKLLFTFEILSGEMQIQMPLGKFSLPTDESQHEICNTATFNFSQLIDPRLIYRK